MNTNTTPSHKFHLILGIISILAIVIFTLQNTEIVTVRFLLWRLEMSRVILMLVVFLLGLLTGYIVRGIRKR